MTSLAERLESQQPMTAEDAKEAAKRRSEASIATSRPSSGSSARRLAVRRSGQSASADAVLAQLHGERNKPTRRASRRARPRGRDAPR
jgi:hypothetical protein